MNALYNEYMVEAGQAGIADRLSQTEGCPRARRLREQKQVKRAGCCAGRTQGGSGGRPGGGSTRVCQAKTGEDLARMLPD